MDLSLENDLPHIVLVRRFINKKGWQLSCHLITGRIVEYLSLENDLSHIVLVKKLM